MQDLIAASPFLALIIALLALLVNIRVAERQAQTAAILAQKQMDGAFAVARRQIVAPIRQKWIDELRSHIAEMIATSQAHWIYPKDVETAHRNLLLIKRKIELMLNPQESDHQALRKELEKLIEVVLRHREDTPLGDFTGALSNATSLAQSVFKREWERGRTKTRLEQLPSLYVAYRAESEARR